jgi:peptide/nickel transport system ATP-binding protein
VLAHCRAEAPPLRDMAPQHLSACWRAPLDPELLLARAEGVTA